MAENSIPFKELHFSDAFDFTQSKFCCVICLSQTTCVSDSRCKPIDSVVLPLGRWCMLTREGQQMGPHVHSMTPTLSSNPLTVAEYRGCMAEWPHRLTSTNVSATPVAFHALSKQCSSKKLYPCESII